MAPQGAEYRYERPADSSSPGARTEWTPVDQTYIRVNIEAMETKGFSRSLDDPESRELRTGEMIRTRHVPFVFESLLFVAALWVFL